jgi:hypothetical protein
MDYSLTTLFVAPVGQTALPSSGSTQDLTPGQIGFFSPVYATADAGAMAALPYFYVAQGRANNYLQGSKRSDQISGRLQAGGIAQNVTEWYKVIGSPTAVNQILEFGSWNVKKGEEVTVTLRAHSSYIDTLYYNGLTKSVTIPATCIECGADPCEDADIDELIDALIAKFNQKAPGTNPDNSSFSNYYTFVRVGSGVNAVLRIEGKPLTKYGVPCDVAANPHEYDRMSFKGWAIHGPATTADFIVDDACDVVSVATIVQQASYASGTSEEIAQLEKNFYSYQAGYLKHLYRMAGYNQNFESYVAAGTSYDTYYIKFRDYSQAKSTWGDYVNLDSMVIIAAPTGSAINTAINAVLVAALGAKSVDNVVRTTTTTTTS